MSSLSSYVTSIDMGLVIDSIKYKIDPDTTIRTAAQETICGNFVDKLLCVDIMNVIPMSPSVVYKNNTNMTQYCLINTRVADYNHNTLVCNFSMLPTPESDIKICRFKYEKPEGVTSIPSNIYLKGLNDKYRGDEKYRYWGQLFKKLESLKSEKLFGVIANSSKIMVKSLGLVIEPLYFEPMVINTTNHEHIDIKILKDLVFRDTDIMTTKNLILSSPEMTKMYDMIAKTIDEKRLTYKSEFSAKQNTTKQNSYWIDIIDIYSFMPDDRINKTLVPLTIDKKNILIMIIRYRQMLHNLILEMHKQNGKNAVAVLAAYIEHSRELEKDM